MAEDVAAITCGSPTFDEIDDDLFEDLEELGEVLDELAKEALESNIAEDLQVATDSVKVVKKDGQDVAIEGKKSDATVDPGKVTGKSDASQGSSVEAQPVIDDDEIEEGEIREDDEKDELRELYKKKTEIVNKMKKLVRHKIQLTSQRNELLQQLQGDTHLDKVNTLLKENTLLVKAISNQIFRMNPEIKIINGKIKELRDSIGSGVDAENKEGEIKASHSSASKKDIENVENFFNRLSSVIEQNKMLKEKTAEFHKEKEKVTGKSFQPESAVDDAEKKTISFHRNRIITKISFDQGNSKTEEEPMTSLRKAPRLTCDNSKLKKIFERVCEMNERKQVTAPGVFENERKQATAPNVFENERKQVTAPNVFDNERKQVTAAGVFANEGKQITASDVFANERKRVTAPGIFENITSSDEKKNTNISGREEISAVPINISSALESSIDFKLKEIRMHTASISSKNVELIDLTSANSKQVSPTKTLITTNKNNIPFNSAEKSARKPKRLIEVNFDEPNVSSVSPNKMIKLNTATSASKGGNPDENNISRSLLQRLGNAFEDGKRSKIATSNPTAIRMNYENNGREGMYSDMPVVMKRKNLHEERDAYWCNYCKRPFKAVHAYVAHLESPNHLATALVARAKGPSENATANDAAAAAASKDAENGSWYEKPSTGVVGGKKTGSNSVGAEEGLCIAVIGGTKFCTKSKLGYSHSRCFSHAKCLVRNSDNNSTDYAPNLCSVCMEYLNYCHSSLQCCERIFRIFKFFKKKFGLKFDWVDKNLKDWFFDNYRKIQSNSSSDKSCTVSYEAFKLLQNTLSDSVSKEPPAEVNAPVTSDDKPASLSDAKKGDLRSVLEKLRSDESSNSSDSQKEVTDTSGDDLCSFLTRFSSLERDCSNKEVHSYKIDFDGKDPFITEVCKNLEFLQTNDIPPNSLLSGLHAQFSCKNEECQQIMTFLPTKPLHLNDISFQLGSCKGLCSKRLMEKFNFIVGITKSHFNYYAVFRAMRSAIEKFSSSNTLDGEVSSFHCSLIQALDCIAKDMVNPLKYYFKLAVIDKRRLRRTGFRFKAKDSIISLLVRENIFSKEVFDQSALAKASESSRDFLSLLNTSNPSPGDGPQLDGLSAIAESESVLKDNLKFYS